MNLPADAEAGNAAERDAAEALLGPWQGLPGGLPPLDLATPERIEAALTVAMRRKRAEVAAIVSNPAPPTFENTVLALERSGRNLEWVKRLFAVFRSTMNTPEMTTVGRRIAPLLPLVDDEIAHDDALFARLEAVYEARDRLNLSDAERRLLGVIFGRMQREGAGLPGLVQARLGTINARLAELQARFSANLMAITDEALIVEHEDDLDGLSTAMRQSAARAAVERGHANKWAIANTFEAVWPFLTQSHRRDLRERVWRMSDERCMREGECDNRPLANEMLRLRAEKARLLGYPDFARYTLAQRMASNPETVLMLLETVWGPVKAATLAQHAELQAFADAEGANISLAPWDRRYYAEKLRRKRFDLDEEAIKPYFKLDNVLEAMFYSARKLLGIELEEVSGAPVCHPTIRVFALSRAGEALGALYLDVVPRSGKSRGSWQMEYRPAEYGDERVLPIASLNSNPPPSIDGEPTLLGWAHANVFFHEFGHALHMLCSKAPFRSLGSESVAWDFIELPSLLNERWLLDRDLLRRFARHHATGEPVPETLLDAIEAGLRYDRVFTLTLDSISFDRRPTPAYPRRPRRFRRRHDRTNRARRTRHAVGDRSHPTRFGQLPHLCRRVRCRIILLSLGRCDGCRRRRSVSRRAGRPLRSNGSYSVRAEHFERGQHGAGRAGIS